MAFIQESRAHTGTAFQLNVFPRLFAVLLVGGVRLSARELRSSPQLFIMEEVMDKDATMGVIVMVVAFVLGVGAPFLLKLMGAWT